jgi:hypothetical protein
VARYRRRPLIVEAEQWSPGKEVPGVRGTGPSPDPGCFIGGRCNRPHVHTVHKGQTVTLEPGDWVIAEPDGLHYYPCKPDVFEATYEPAGEPSCPS